MKTLNLGFSSWRNQMFGVGRQIAQPTAKFGFAICKMYKCSSKRKAINKKRMTVGLSLTKMADTQLFLKEQKARV